VYLFRKEVISWNGKKKGRSTLEENTASFHGLIRDILLK
jgi:hypothetical protein